MGSIGYCSHCGSVFHETRWCPFYSSDRRTTPSSIDTGNVSTVFLLNDFPSSTVDLHQGPHKCKHCGSNNHPTAWCPNKINPDRNRFGADYQVWKVTDLPQGPQSDPREGEHRCMICGSNVHPTVWCTRLDKSNAESLAGDIVCEKCQKDKGECNCVRGPMVDFATPGGDMQIFKVTNLPEPPVDELKPPRCAQCGSVNHYGVFGCPEWGQKNLWNPGSKKEWFGLGSGHPGRRYR